VIVGGMSGTAGEACGSSKESLQAGIGWAGVGGG
jgi:hypothetical protein